MTSFYSHWLRPFLFRMDAEEAHAFATRFLPLFPAISMPHDPALATDLGDPRLQFQHPVGLAAGFDKDGRWIRPLARLGFSTIEVGTVTPAPQPGNDRPRLFRFPEQHALVNRLGFNNDGGESLHLRLKGKRFPVPVGINLGKQRETRQEDAPADYAALSARLADVADYFVLNVSSPNTPGLRNLQSGRDLRAILRAVREALRGKERPPPCFCKLSPDLGPGELEEAISVSLDEGAGGFILTNTTVDRSSLGNRAPASGGLSGRPLAAMAEAALIRAARTTGGSVPLIAVGGIFTGEDAFARIRAGASLVQIYTSLVYEGPGIVRSIVRELSSLLAREGFATLKEAVGSANR